MIERYAREEMLEVWSEQSMYQHWLNIEIAVCEAYRHLGKIPRASVARIKERATFKIDRIRELEKQIHHDMLAFLTCVSESVDSEDSRFIHLGLTSSDVKDTALSLMIKEAGGILVRGLDELLQSLKELALEHKGTVCIGRSHGVHAEPTTFGLKMLVFYDDLKRAKKNIIAAVEDNCVGMFSGAVGTFANLDPQIEKITCEHLGLKPALITTQVISRDRHACFMNALAVAASVMERLALEVRHLQRTEVLEVEEPFYRRQKGSSAMPHKRNPWRSENISGLARMVRAYAGASLENIMLWHERDISHSSTERIALPDCTILVDFMVNRLTQILRGLKVYPENMQANLNKFGGVIFSQQVLMRLIHKGLKRESAYEMVQDFAHDAWNKADGNFKQMLMDSADIGDYLTKEEIEACFDPQYHLKNIDYIYDQVLGLGLSSSSSTSILGSGPLL
ncbi:MAG: adenylosuccinate lyase [Candidatus Caenarcaniphilales bacterium]|jgi:adenylosuccinate lyase|nr:adenylosuccinate lyase [Candidatus Caenarcaniphilales bacterium]